MKRWLFFLIAGAVLLFLPKGQELDIAKLQPAELIYIYIEEGRITVRTDMDDMGIGYALDGALEDMRKTAPGEIFLDTVDYVLVTEETKDVVPELENVLRPSAHILLATGSVDPRSAAAFLAVHEPDVTLKDCMMEKRELPKLMTAEERYYLE